MRCDELERDLGCFMDGELAPPEQREVETHLHECAACRSQVEEQRHIKQLLRQSLVPANSSVAPAGLVQRVRAALDDSEGRSGWRFYSWATRTLGRTAVGILVPVAAALALVVGYVETVEPLVNESIVRHQRNLPLEVTGGPEKVQSWFDGKVPFAVPAPRLGPNCPLRGGRISHLGAHEAALLQYDQNGQKISVFVFDAQGVSSPLRLRMPARRMIGNREVFLEDEKGYHAAFFRDRGLGYAITGSVDESDFIELISAAVGQHPK